VTENAQKHYPGGNEKDKSIMQHLVISVDVKTTPK
jgi:hypothetical protein